MNKEVNYVLQGFLLTLVVIGTLKFGGYLLSIPPPPEAPLAEEMQGVSGNAPTPQDPIMFSKGKTLFLENCAACHSLKKDLTGPALAGVNERITDKEQLYKWIRNPSAVLGSGNVYFNELKKRFGGVVMTSFSNLTDDEIESVLSYIKDASK